MLRNIVVVEEKGCTKHYATLEDFCKFEKVNYMNMYKKHIYQQSEPFIFGKFSIRRFPILRFKEPKVD